MAGLFFCYLDGIILPFHEIFRIVMSRLLRLKSHRRGNSSSVIPWGNIMSKLKKTKQPIRGFWDWVFGESYC